MKNTLLEINRLVTSSLADFIADEEQKYLDIINSTAAKIAQGDKVKIVLLAGPSGSGKTTTAHLLCSALEKLGKRSTVVSLDDFYLSAADSPLLPDGRRDTESVNALDLPVLEKCLCELINTGKTCTPVFDFSVSARSEKTNIVDITDGGIAIVEGLHALNPKVTEHIGKNSILKIYISVSEGICNNEGERLLSSRQVRLIRRALRDEIFRNSTIKRTLHLWTGVVQAEEKYLYAYKPAADIIIATLHAYEVGVYRERFLNMAESVTPDCENYDYFMRTARAVKQFISVPEAAIPQNSLIREFIGLKKQ